MTTEELVQELKIPSNNDPLINETYITVTYNDVHIEINRNSEAIKLQHLIVKPHDYGQVVVSYSKDINLKDVTGMNMLVTLIHEFKNDYV